MSQSNQSSGNDPKSHPIDCEVLDMLGIAHPDRRPFADPEWDEAYRRFCESLHLSEDRLAVVADPDALCSWACDASLGTLALVSMLMRPRRNVMKYLQRVFNNNVNRSPCGTRLPLDAAGRRLWKRMRAFAGGQHCPEAGIAFPGRIAPRELVIARYTAFNGDEAPIMRVVTFNRSWALVTVTGMIDTDHFPSRFPLIIGFASTADLCRGVCRVLTEPNPESFPTPFFDRDCIPKCFAPESGADLDQPVLVERWLKYWSLGCDQISQEMIFLAWVRFGNMMENIEEWRRYKIGDTLLACSDWQLHDERRQRGTLLNVAFVRRLFEPLYGPVVPEDDEEDEEYEEPPDAPLPPEPDDPHATKTPREPGESPAVSTPPELEEPVVTSTPRDPISEIRGGTVDRAPTNAAISLCPPAEPSRCSNMRGDFRLPALFRALRRYLPVVNIERYIPEVPRDAFVYHVVDGDRILCSGYGDTARDAAVRLVQAAREIAASGNE